MAEMAARITLTFNDLGSPGLKALQALIEGMGPKVTGLSQRFNTLERSIERVGNVAQSAVAKITAYDNAIQKTVVSTDAAATSNAKLETTLGTLVGTIRQLTTAVGDLSKTYSALGNAAQGVSGHMNTAAGAFSNANMQLSAMQGHATGVTNALRGMAEMWAAQKIFKAGAAATNEASEMQLLEARMKALNLPAGENEEMLSKSKTLSNSMKFVSQREALETRISAVTGIGRNTSELTDPQVNNIIEKTLPTAIRTARLLQARGDKSELNDIVRNLYGLTEARGQTSNPERMNETFDLTQRGLASTGGKITIKDLDTAMRQMKYGERAMINDDGILAFIAYMNQLKASGHGGGGSGGSGVSQAGTMATMMAKFAEGGVRNKEAIHMLSTMGLYDESKVTGETTTNSVNTAPGGLAFGTELVRDPIGTVMKHFAPAFVKFAKDNPNIYFKGKNVNDPGAIDEAITKIAIQLFAGQGGQTVAQGFAVGAQAGPASQIQSEVKMSKNAKGIDESMKDLNETFNQNVAIYDKQVANLALTFGQVLLPAVTAVLKALTTFIEMLNTWAQENPEAAKITTIALAIAGVALALSGLQRMFLIFTALAEMLGAGAVAAGGFAAAWAGAGTAITGVLAVIGVAIKRIIPLAGAFLVGWDVGSLIANLDIGGKTVLSFVSELMNNVVARFERGWIEVQRISRYITDAEARRRTQRVNNQEMNVQDTYDPNLPKPTTPKPTVYSETPEEAFRRGLEEASKKLRNMAYKPIDKNAGKLFPNPAAASEKQDARVAAAEEAAALRALAAEYHATLIGVDTYYNKKKELITSQQDKVIAALEREKEELEKPSKGRKDEVKIAAVSADIKIAKINKVAALEAVESDKTRDKYALDQKILDGEREGDAVSGHRHTAEIKRLNERLDTLKKIYEVNEKTEAAAAIPAARVRGLAAIDYNEMYRGLSVQLTELKVKEQELDDAVAAGTLTETNALHQKWLLRIEEGRLVDSLIDKMKALAAASGDEKLINQVAEMGRVAKRNMESLSPEVTKVKNILEAGFATFFVDATNNVKGLKASFQDFFLSVIKGLQAMAAQILAQDLGSLIFKGGNTGTGSNMVTGLLGFLGLGGKASTAGNAASFNYDPLLPEFETGIDTVPRDMYAKIHAGEAVLKPGEAADWRAGSSVTSSGPTTNNVSIKVDAGGTTASGDAGRSTELAKVLVNVVQQEMIKQKRPGGILA